MFVVSFMINSRSRLPRYSRDDQKQLGLVICADFDHLTGGRLFRLWYFEILVLDHTCQGIKKL